MSSHAVVLHLRVSAKQYADAARQLHAGNFNANPVAVALIEQGEYIMCGYTGALITLMDIKAGRHYTCSVPAGLAYYLAGFQRGRRVLEDHEFELVLESEVG